MGTLNTQAVQTIFKQTFTRQIDDLFSNLLRFERGIFLRKLGKKDTFWHGEYNRITAIKSAKNKPWSQNENSGQYVYVLFVRTQTKFGIKIFEID